MRPSAKSVLMQLESLGAALKFIEAISQVKLAFVLVQVCKCIVFLEGRTSVG